jgi:hypothetical protein
MWLDEVVPDPKLAKCILTGFDDTKIIAMFPKGRNGINTVPVTET